MANQGPLVKVDDGRGNRLKLTRKEADARVAANPGAFIVGQGEVEVAAAPAEVETGGDISFTSMKVDELRAYAGQEGIDLGDASKKADIIADIIAAIEGADAEDGDQ